MEPRRRPGTGRRRRPRAGSTTAHPLQLLLALALAPVLQLLLLLLPRAEAFLANGGGGRPGSLRTMTGRTSGFFNAHRRAPLALEAVKSRQGRGGGGGSSASSSKGKGQGAPRQRRPSGETAAATPARGGRGEDTAAQLIDKGPQPVAAPTTPPPFPVPEVLAPAGGREQFLAALNAGADAVFLGLKAFNARARAENFGVEDLRELVPLAHRYGMQVLVTVNVLIKEGELGNLVETLAALEELEVDAVIVQDQAVGSLAKRFFPRLRLHASTQMAVHNLQGVVTAAALGYRRVVLARELTAKEMKDIRSAVRPEVAQLEAFCHGSLCYSYSGLCFFSGEKDARSGNRGECAYTCRQPYKITNEDEFGMGFLFSMMDLDTSHDLGLLAEAGVDTLKIEGRKKDAQYVASSVQLYRRRLDQLYGRPTLRPSAPPEAAQAVGTAARRDDGELRADLALSFHRGTTSFFTKGRYHENVIDLDNAGHLGLPAGRVHSVSKDGRSFRLYPEVPLERFDGLRVVPPSRAFHAAPQHGQQAGPGAATARDEDEEGDMDAGGGGSGSGMGRLVGKYENALPEFGLRNFKVDGQKAFEAPRGAAVDVEVPIEVRRGWEQHGQRPIKPGDLVFKARSNELKRRVEALAAVPAEYKAKAWRTVDVSAAIDVDADGRELVLEVTVRKLGRELVRESLRLPLEYSARAGRTRADLLEEVGEILGVYGEAGFRAQGGVSVEGLGGGDEDREGAPVLHLPRKELKALKQRVLAALPGAYADFVEGRKRTALRELGLLQDHEQHEEEEEGLPPAEWGDRRFAIKVDRPEYLVHLDAYLQGLDDATRRLVEEVIFEPKRMYLADTAGAPAAGVAALRALAERHGVRVRLALPTVNRAWDIPPLRGWVQAFADAAAAAGEPARFEVGNLGAWGLLEEMGLGPANMNVDLATDFTLYALNSETTRVWARELRASCVALSVEDDAENLRAHMARWPRGGQGQGQGVGEAARPQYILFKDVPLFMAEACSLTALHGGCPGSKVCGYRTLKIENDAGERYEVAHEHCKSVVYAEDAQSLVHRQGTLLDMGIRDFRVDFLTRHYDAAGLGRVLDAALRREAGDLRPLPRTHVANFDRRLL